MKNDDVVNVAILIAALLFFAFVIPATLRQSDDADQWTETVKGMGR